MKIRHALTIIMTAFLIWGSGPTPAATAQALPENPLRVLSSDEQGIVLELTVADFQVETVEDEGQTFHRLLIPGMTQTDTPGAPQVPARGALLGLPGLTDVSVQVLEASYETLRGYRLLPGPSMEIATDSLNALPSGDFQLTFAPNRELYATDAFYPGQPVALGTTGYLRDQAVAQVQFYPVQYNPVIGEVRLYRHILARATWSAPLSLAATKRREASPAFEHVLQDTILNYDALERPPVPDGAPSFGPTPPTPYLTSASSSANTKIGVTEDGLYALTYSDLTGAGFDPSSVDPRTVKISHRGAEIPIYIEGEDDGVFDSTDTVLFYGTAITDVYTVKNVYWLTAGGSAGQRMATRDGTPSGATVPTDFPATVHAEEDTYYWVTMPDGEGQDHWFWEGWLTAPASRDYSLTLNNVSTTASTATVRIRLKGRTDTSTNPDHHTRITLNGVKVDNQQWDGQIVFDHEVTATHFLLKNGSNTITVESPGDTGASVDQIFVNWIEIDYWDTYVAEDDQLLFGAPEDGTFQFEVTNFSGNDVQVFDVTDPTDVAVITDTVVMADGGSYTLRFEDASQPVTRYLALTPAQRKSPASVELDDPSTWKDPANGADYVIITHEDFHTSALRLASHRSAAGLRVATVIVEDVYDEFNGGILHPQAIRDFLAYAYDHWARPAPTYILLLGGASYDYRDLLGLNRDNYVPTQIVETQEVGQTPSDNWFVLVSGDDILPDMSIGRLTAQTTSEAEDMVDKIIAYEQNPPAGSWNTDVLLVADDDEPAFETLSDELADHLPHYYTATRVYVGNYPPGDPTVDIAAAIDGGSVLVNYAGHGNVDMWGVWSGGRTFDRSPDVTLLNNTHRLPVVTVGTCLNGYFAGKNTSTAEEFLRLQDKGAVAVWADAGMGFPSDHRALLGALYEGIFQDDQHEYGLGAAMWAAKIAFAQSSPWSELIQTFTLFGDPATQLGIPANYPYVESTTPIDGASDVDLDQEIQIVFSKPMSPTTVLLSGPGTTEVVFAPPTWSAGDTMLSYAHTGFDYNQTLTFTISGQDRMETALRSGPAPSTWSFTMPFAPTGVPISGPATGVVHTSYTFNATVSPGIATQPITYVWEATGQSLETHTNCGLNDAVSFHWDTPGTKTVTVTASNVAGYATETHDVTIYVPPASVEVTGPTMGAIDTAVTFNAAVSPGTASQPITYVWEATDQPPMTHTGSGLDDAVTFNWDTPGLKTITVTASNGGGTVVDTVLVTVKAPPTGVEIGGRTTGVVQVDYTFTAAVGPINATPPFTYTWEATGQTPSTHVGGDLSDAVIFNWDTPGAKTITVTVANDVGTATNTAQVALDYSPPANVEIAGPTKAAVDTAYTFSAAVGPITATRPITYVWRATGQPVVTHTDGELNDSVDFTWSVTGTKMITVTATNAGGAFTQRHQVTVWSSSVDIAGPAAGIVQADYTFTATVNPSTSPQPVTYTWQATGQAPLTHAGRGLNDTATFNWDTPGPKTIDVTATNADGTLTNTYEVSITYAPPTRVDVTGPMTGTVDTACTLNAAVSPITATQPITYVWQATGQPSVTHPGGELNDAVTFTWNVTGTKTISVTATNAGGAASNHYFVTINETSQRTVYLPLVIRND